MKKYLGIPLMLLAWLLAIPAWAIAETNPDTWRLRVLVVNMVHRINHQVSRILRHSTTNEDLLLLRH